MKKTKRGKIKREFKDLSGFMVFENRAFFSDYLENEVGAKWQTIKRTLYDAGYTAAEVNEYRDGLLSDFRELCAAHGFKTYI